MKVKRKLKKNSFSNIVKKKKKQEKAAYCL